ncbi:MAG: hypothetical protein OXF26_14375, partial [Alphaproteobacteria bacterium]|nr:hypothetical protein [Alphaproteobacteria bacterium]
PARPARIMLAAGTALLILQLLLDLAGDLNRLAQGGKALSVRDIIERDIGGIENIPASSDVADYFGDNEDR